jgi:AraC family transcriptional regulator, transcriptional activator of pobA
MDSILQFDEITDYVHAMNLNTESRKPDFFIYDYKTQHPESCSLLHPFRHNYFEIALETTRSCDLSVDQFETPEAESRLTLISPHRLQTLRCAANNGQPHHGYSILFKPEFISTNSVHSRLLKDFPFFSHLNTPFISLDRKQSNFFEDLIRKIQVEHENYSTHSHQIIQHYLNILFLKAGESYQPADSPKPLKNRDREIFDEFSVLTQRHHLEWKSVKQYAEKLHITPKYLSETVKNVSGQSALSHIHQAQINHAKALLRQTSKTVTEIAYDLNFDNPEYFSVFFKRVSGESPSQYRGW